MIVAWNDLPNLAGLVVMVDGSFDPLHEGHIAYFEAASKFNRLVLCNIADDAWTTQKHPILLPQESRARVIDAIRFISYVHCSRRSTRDVLSQLRPHSYVKGLDWLGRGGVPTDEADLCAQLGIEVRYVDTVMNSSSKLLENIRRQ